MDKCQTKDTTIKQLSWLQKCRASLLEYQDFKYGIPLDFLRSKLSWREIKEVVSTEESGKWEYSVTILTLFISTCKILVPI